MNRAEGNRYLYAWEGIACIVVMMYHCPLPGEVGLFLRAMARFAVPLFFAVTGKYLMEQWKSAEVTDAAALRGLVRVRIGRTLRVTLLVLAVHTVYSLVWYLVRGETAFSWLRMKYTPVQWARLILFNTGNVIFDGSVIYDHLWYLLALMYALTILYMCGAWLLPWARVVSPAMLVLLYAGLHLQKRMHFATLVVSSADWFLFRNWLFFALPFVLLGAALYNTNLRDKGLWIAIAGLFLTAVEHRALGMRELYFGSLLTVIGALCGEYPVSEDTRPENRDARQSVLDTFAYIGQYLSKHVYYWHLMVYSVWIWILWVLPGDLHAQPLTAWGLPLGTYVVTIMVAYLIKKQKGI